MVDFTFKELEEFIAEISLIIIALALIVLVSVFPNPATLSLFNDVIFLIVGAVIGILGGKQIAKSNEVEEEEEEKKDDVA